MLTSLEIENLAIIESAGIELAPGLNAITGETGAGKSILVGALELTLGARATADVVRKGQRIATVEAVFDPPFPAGVGKLLGDELELEWSPKEPLTLRREVSVQGRSRSFIGGQLVNVADLRRLGELLVDLHGQHEHQSLLRLAAQRTALDAFAECEELLANYRQRYEKFTALRRRQAELVEQAQDFEKRLDFLTYQIEEIEEVDPQPGELAELAAEEARLAHAETLAASADRAYSLLYEGVGDEATSALSALREAARALEQIAEFDPGMKELPKRCAEVEALAEDLAFTLRDYAQRCEANPARLEEVIARIESIRRLLRKHALEDDSGLPGILSGLTSEREKMNLDESERGEIDEKLAAARKDVGRWAARLSKARREAAGRLGKTVSRTLGRIGMEKAKFEATVEPIEEPTRDGADRVEFLLAANVGEGKKSLRETVSGGELSRTMLAIKTALAKRDAIPTLIFDEIDAGISGETAARVGALMEELGRSHQVVCITHHASIAARAGHHLSVRKAVRGGRTTMSALDLGRDDRVEELARMMGGDGESAAGKRLARQLLGAGK